MTFVKRHTTILSLLLVATSGNTFSKDLYVCTDDNGGITYTDSKLHFSNCKVASSNISSVGDPTPKRIRIATDTPGRLSTSPSDFPKVSYDLQKNRDTDRRRILEQEMSDEQKRLAESKILLSSPETIKLSADKAQAMKDRVALHERNIVALEKELRNLR